MEVSSDHIRLLEEIAAVGAKGKYRVCLVGGIVRDFLLHHEFRDRDCDLVIEGEVRSFTDWLRERVGGIITSHQRFLTATLAEIRPEFGCRELDIVTARTEHYPSPGALPVIEPASIEEDLGRRDFSINSLAIPVTTFLEEYEDGLQSFLDPFGGVQDLKERLIRILHEQSFIDDPTRIFRAARYVSRLDGKLEAGTADSLKSALEMDCLATISLVRKWNEWRLILGESQAVKAVECLERWGVLERLPELSLFRSSPDAFERLVELGKTLPGAEFRDALIVVGLNLHEANGTLSDLSGLGISKKNRMNWLRHSGERAAEDTAELVLSFVLEGDRGVLPELKKLRVVE